MSQKQLISLMVLLLLAFFAFSGSNKIHNDTDIPLSPSVTEEIKDTETPLVVEVADTVAHLRWKVENNVVAPFE